jgi:hypothetical protein
MLQVEDLLRETLKREVRKWRARRGPTSFNADVSNRLAEVHAQRTHKRSDVAYCMAC